MPRGVLFSQMEPAPEWEEAFNAWYDEEHVPSRLALPGFVAAARYVAVRATPKYAVTYLLDDLGALATPAYRALKSDPAPRTAQMLAAVRGFTRYVGEEVACLQQDPGADADVLDSPYLYAVFFAVPEAREAEFGRWYDQEHGPLLLRHPAWRALRRYRLREAAGGAWTHLTLHYLDDLAALESPERAAARATPWRERLAAEPWFVPEAAVYARLPRRWGGGAR